MELDFLFLINFSLFVSPSVYTTYYTELMNHATNPTIECDKCGEGSVMEVEPPSSNVNIPNKAFV